MSSSTIPTLPSKIGKYRIVRLLGSGGAGVVYLAEDPLLGRKIALKVLKAESAGRSDSLDRFLLEARSAAQLSHVHTVAVYEVDVDRSLPGEEHPYIAMEWMAGGSAEDALQSTGPLDWKEATRWLADACRGLKAAHDAGLLHRDIKPSNLLRTADGVGKLGDFGLVKSVAGENPLLTAEGTLMGTPAYMSPEQCQGEPLDFRSDIYSLGATYFALLAGRPPFEASTNFAVMFAHCSSAVPDLATFRPDIPLACRDLVTRAMSKAPADRFPDTAAILEALDRVAHEKESTPSEAIVYEMSSSSQTVSHLDPTTLVDRVPRPPQTTSRRRRWMIAAGVLSAAALGGNWFLTRPNSDSKSPAEPPFSSSDTKLVDVAVPSPPAKETPPEPGSVVTESIRADSIVLGRHTAEVQDIRVPALADDPKSSVMMTCGSDGIAALWNVHPRKQGGELVARFKDPHPSQPELFAIGWLPRRQRLVTGGSGPELLVWDTKTGKILSRAEHPHVVVLSMDVAPDMQTVVTGGHVGIHRWELDAKDRLISRGTLRDDMLMVRTVAFSCEQSVFAAGGQHGTQGMIATWSGLFWNVGTDFGKRRDFRCSCIAFSRNRAEFVMCTETGKLRHGVYSARKSTEGDIPTPIKNPRSADFHPECRLVAFGGKDSNSLFFVRLDNRAYFEVPLDIPTGINVVRFTSDGKSVLVGTPKGGLLSVAVPPAVLPPITPKEEMVLDQVTTWFPDPDDMRKARKFLDELPPRKIPQEKP